MNFSALESAWTCCTPTEGVLHAFCKPRALKLASFGTYFGSPESQCQISSRLTGTCGEMARQTEYSDSQSPYTCHDLLNQTTLTGFRTLSLVSVQNLGGWVTILTKLASYQAMKVWDV